MGDLKYDQSELRRKPTDGAEEMANVIYFTFILTLTCKKIKKSFEPEKMLSSHINKIITSSKFIVITLCI